MKPSLRFYLAAATLLAITFAVYLPGLDGDFILDDRHNLAPVLEFARGEITWDEAVLSASGRFGRPLAMATFLGNVASTANPADLIWSFKLTNLLIHLLTGLLVFALLRSLLAHDRHLGASANWIALSITALWLLAPLQVSTVLYTIQRMAQLSALFVLLGLLAYVTGRNKVIQGHLIAGASWLLLVFPLMMILDVMNKENALLLPLLATIIEVAYFGRQSRPAWPMGAFYVLFMALPGAVAVTYLIANPDTIMGGYSIRDFTLSERLLSQPRALFGYLGSLFVPNAHGLGLFHDDFVVSKSLFSPVSTLVSLLGWAALLALAWIAWLKQRATLTFGIVFFLGAHSLESGIFPLEIYFEHRNYLPSLGALAAAVAGCHWALDLSEKLRRLAPVFLVVFACLFAGATWARTGIWASNQTMVEQAAKGHPDSPRVRVHLATGSARQNKIDEALEHLAVARRGDPVNAPTYALNVVSVYCLANQPVPDTAYAVVTEAAPSRVTAATTGTYRSLVEQLDGGYCPQLELPKLKQAVDAWITQIDAHAEPDSVSMQYSWLLRMFHSRVAAKLNLYDEAIKHAERAYQLVPHRVDVGLYLIQMQLAAGQLTQAGKTVAMLEGSYTRGNPKYDRALAELKAIVESEVSQP